MVGMKDTKYNLDLPSFRTMSDDEGISRSGQNGEEDISLPKATVAKLVQGHPPFRLSDQLRTDQDGNRITTKGIYLC